MSDIESKEEDINELMDQMSDDERRSISEDNIEDMEPIEDNKSFIIDLVNKMDNRLSFVTKEGKSEVWNRYQRIYYMKRETNFVKCLNCNDIKKQTKYLGTATLLRHQCSASDLLTTDGHNDQTVNTRTKSNHTINESNVESYNDKSFLVSLIQSSDRRLCFEPQIGKSQVWKRFQRVLFDDIETDYVKCNDCNDIVKQTRYLGTSALVRHRCRSLRRSAPKRGNKYINRQKVLQKKKCLNFDQKIRVENNSLKTIVKKCLEVIEKCLCINRSVVLEKKRINVLINAYNEWLSENQEFEECDEKNFEDFYGQQMDESDPEVINECDSNQDLDYDPSEDNKSKPLFAQKGIKCKNNSIIVSNFVKRKYIKRKVVSNHSVVCDWPQCGRQFKNSYNLQQHRNKTHIGANRYRCDWPGCDETFNLKVKYEVHICSHTNEKKFKCDFEGCSYESCRSTMLQRHKKIHSDDKPFVCEWPGCEYRSSYKKGLRNHFRYHTGERPFRCSWPSCEWKFKQTTHLKAHMLKHTGERPYQCEFANCERRFASRQAMRFHCEKFHNFVIPLK